MGLRPLWLGLVFLAGAAMLGALMGLTLGGLVGWIAPDYYRAIFHRASPELNPVSLGVGLGLVQGGGGGAALGAALLFARWWLVGRKLSAEIRSAA